MRRGARWRSVGGGWRGLVAGWLWLGLAAAVSAADGRAGRTTLPSWAVPAETAVDPAKPYMPFNDARFGTAHMRASVCRLLYVLKRYPEHAVTPFWTLRTGQFLLDLEEDGAAAVYLNRVLDLPANVPYSPRNLPFPDLAALQRDARFVLTRCRARAGLGAEAVADLQALAAKSGYDLTREAEIRMLLDDREGALAAVRRAGRDGHPEGNFSSLFVGMRAAVLAHQLGDQGLALKLADPVVRQPQTAQKWPQFQSAWAVLKETCENARRPATPPWRDGEYSGTCRAFITDLRVAVVVRQGRLGSVQVTQQREDRPWSALDVIPQRIVRRQRLDVDAVSGATITSYAVGAAVEEALGKASATR